MNKMIVLSVAGLALTAAGHAFAADLPPQMPVKASFAERFTWTGCYLGAHVGGGWIRNAVTDPVLLVQDDANLGGPGFTTGGPTTVGVNESGAVIGGQIGCDYQFPSNFVLGVEGAASGGTMKGSSVVALADSPPDTALVSVKTDFVTALTGRAGYAVDHWLFYGKGGVAWANSKYSVTGTFNGGVGAGLPFDFEGLSIRTGWTAGAGAEWAFAQDWSARLEYDYYDFGSHTATMNDAANGNGPGPLSFKTTMQTVKLGVNFHVWGLQ
jgi:outer membrane immunogenic protein